MVNQFDFACGRPDAKIQLHPFNSVTIYEQFVVHWFVNCFAGWLNSTVSMFRCEGVRVGRGAG